MQIGTYNGVMGDRPVMIVSSPSTSELSRQIYDSFNLAEVFRRLLLKITEKFLGRQFEETDSENFSLSNDDSGIDMKYKGQLLGKIHLTETTDKEKGWMIGYEFIPEEYFLNNSHH